MYQGGYPTGAEYDMNAPYNQPIIEPEEIEVDVCLSMSTRIKVKVDDYDLDEDFDEDTGKKILVPNFDNVDFVSLVKNQIRIPTEMYEFKDWTIDDLQAFPV